MKTTENTMHQLNDSFCGYCPECKTITAFDGVEPDAEGYHCDDCDGNRLMGASQALLMGYIKIVDANPEDDSIFIL